MSDLAWVFTAGLLGSVHCIGMCGGFVLAISQAQDRAAGLRHQVVYAFGKALTYAVLGAAAGGVGSVLVLGLGGWQRGLSIGLGLLMVVIGLGLVGVLRRVEGFSRVAGWPVFQHLLGYFLSRRTYGTSLGLGLVNGLLPCALVYALLVKAGSTGSVGAGAVTMFVFGLATVPALLALGLTGHLMRPVWRVRLNLAAGVVVIALGIVTVLRGTPALDGLLHGPHAQHGMNQHERVTDDAMPGHRH